MRIKMLRSLGGNPAPDRYEGTEYEVEDGEGRELLAAGLAVEADVKDAKGGKKAKDEKPDK